MDWAMQAWPEREVNSSAHIQAPTPTVLDATEVLSSAKQSQNQEQKFNEILQAQIRNPSVSAAAAATVKDVQIWLQELQTRCNTGGKRVLNK